MKRLLVGALAIWLLSVRAGTAQPKDIAGLFPQKPLLYVEVTQPETVAKDLTQFLRGSTLENPSTFFKPKNKGQKGKEDDWYDRTEAGILATLLGPTFRSEAKKFEGMAFAITGFDPRGNLEWVAVLKPGTSKLPSTLVKSLVSEKQFSRPWGKSTLVEGVPIHALVVRSQNENREFNGLGQVETSILIRVAVAEAPNLIVVASSQESIANAIKRWKGKDTSLSFAESAAFPNLATKRNQPGLFAVCNPTLLVEGIERQLRSQDSILPTAWIALRDLLPVKQIPEITVQMRLSDGEIRGTANIRIGDSEVFPLSDLFAGQALTADQLQIPLSDRPFVLCLTLPKEADGPRKTARVLDVFSKATGTLGPTPTELLQELETKQPGAGRLLSKLRNITLLFAVTQESGKAKGWPYLLCNCEDNDSAQAIEALLPALLEPLSNELPQPIVETIEGVKVRSFILQGVPLHSCRVGARLCLGTDRKYVASLANANRDKLQAIAQDANRRLLQNSAAFGIRWDTMGKPRPKGEAIDRGSPTIRPLLAPKENARAPGLSPLAEELQGLPPLWLSARRNENSIHLEWLQSPGKAGFAKLLSEAFAQFARARNPLDDDDIPDLMNTPGLLPPLP